MNSGFGRIIVLVSSLGLVAPSGLLNERNAQNINLLNLVLYNIDQVFMCRQCI